MNRRKQKVLAGVTGASKTRMRNVFLHKRIGTAWAEGRIATSGSPIQSHEILLPTTVEGRKNRRTKSTGTGNEKTGAISSPRKRQARRTSWARAGQSSDGGKLLFSTARAGSRSQARGKAENNQLSPTRRVPKNLEWGATVEGSQSVLKTNGGERTMGVL